MTTIVHVPTYRSITHQYSEGFKGTSPIRDVDELMIHFIAKAIGGKRLEWTRIKMEIDSVLITKCKVSAKKSSILSNRILKFIFPQPKKH